MSSVSTMEDQEASLWSTSRPAVVSGSSYITAQDAGVANVPQVTGCHVGGSLNITLETHLHAANAKEAHQQTSATRASESGCRTSERVTEKLKLNLKRKFETIFEGTAKRGNPSLLNKIYTELYITEGERKGLNEEHEVWQIDPVYEKPPRQDVAISCNDIFKPLNDQNLERETNEEKTKGIKPTHCQKAEKKQPRTVMTKGIAGIGKTVSVQKFIIDWAEGKSNQDIDLLVVLPFRELNSIKDEKYSLHELLLDFYPELKEFEGTGYFAECKMIFIFDGLDESQLPFHFGYKRVSVISRMASLDALLTNLIEGNLLPSALVWITSRPAAIDKVPPDLIHRMTEVRGFTDLQKEEYFRKRISDHSLASRIISHVKGSRTLEIMCHIPAFCWITATVLEQMLRGGQENVPASLTEMYTRFLLIQTSEKKKKYLGTWERDPRKLSDEDVQLVLKLGKLAFDNLQKSNIVFSEDDLKKYEIDINEASLRSGVFTEILREEDPMFLERKYSFVHLSFQEYLAAFYVLHTFANTGVNPMQPRQNMAFLDDDGYGDDGYDDDGYDDDYAFYHENLPQGPQQKVTLHELQKYAVDEALKIKSGNLDLFLRFLLGLSMESCQKLLISIPMHVESDQRSIQDTAEYIKSKLREEDDTKTPTNERCINLLHCLLELNDHSMAEEIRRFLTSGRQAEHKLTAGQCSALAYIILMSGEVLEELDLKKYNTSAEGRRRLVPAVKSCRKAVMSDCDLTGECCETVASALQHPSERLRELDLSQNILGEKAVTSLCAGLNSPHCKLESLNLSHINLERTGASLLDAVLNGPHIQLHTLQVFSCGLKDECADILVTALCSSECRLKELDLSYNNLSSGGIKHVIQGLLGPNTDLRILRLSGISVGADSCVHLASVLRHSSLRELHLGSSNIGNVGAKHLCHGLMSPHCQLQKLWLRDCSLSKKACLYLSLVLSTYSVVRELNLGDNDLQDSGVQLLSTALKNPNCILENLGLSGCRITEHGCSSLASALKSNPSHLRELDLSYNHPGETGERLLAARLRSPACKLETVKLGHGGRSRLTPGLWKYYQELNMGYTQPDLECSADRKGVIRLPVLDLFLDDSDEEKKEPVTWATARTREPLTGGRFYWEVEWTGYVAVGVSDKELMRKSLVLILHHDQGPYFAMHQDQGHTKSIPAVSRGDVHPQRIGVLLDWPAGTLSFYRISSQGASRLYTFHTTFSNHMYPVFKLNLADTWHEVPSVAMATHSPTSTQHTKAQLYQHVKDFTDLHNRVTCRRGVHVPILCANGARFFWVWPKQDKEFGPS